MTFYRNCRPSGLVDYEDDEEEEEDGDYNPPSREPGDLIGPPFLTSDLAKRKLGSNRDQEQETINRVKKCKLERQADVDGGEEKLEAEGKQADVGEEVEKADVEEEEVVEKWSSACSTSKSAESGDNSLQAASGERQSCPTTAAAANSLTSGGGGAAAVEVRQPIAGASASTDMGVNGASGVSHTEPYPVR